MKTLAIRTLVALVAAVAVSWTSPALADTVAEDDPPVLIAQDPSPAPSSVPARVVGIDANVVNGLSVTGHAGKPVTARAKGHPTRTATGAGSKPAILRGLTPGVQYKISIDGRVIGQATPLGQVGPASGLRVETTNTSGSVDVSWAHTVLAGEGRAVTYTVTATPLTTDGTDSTPAISASVNALSTTLSGLDTARLYRFTVTARNSASAGRSSSATMTHVLGGSTPTIDPKPVTPAPAPTPTPTPAPVPAPAPAPPATQTIYVCPGGFSDTGSSCQKLLAYTYHDQTVTTPYTYHQDPIYGYGQTGWSYSWGYCTGSGKSGNWENGDPYCQSPVFGNDAIVGYQTVKDAPPGGWVDNGTAYSRVVSVKDSTPTGYTDNGTQWVSTVAKVPQVVPA